MNIQKCTFQTVTILGASSILHMYSTVCKRVIHQKAICFSPAGFTFVCICTCGCVCMSLNFSSTVFRCCCKKCPVPSIQSLCTQ